MEHYVGTASKADEAQIRYPMPEGSVAGKDVLIIDDIADTGGSIRRAEEYVTERDASTVRTATLQLLSTSAFEPDFIGEHLEQWTWVVYPWNFIEDMIDIIAGAMERADAQAFDTEAIRHHLEADHGVGRIEMEVAQPGRLDEVLEEMERREVIESTGRETWTLLE